MEDSALLGHRRPVPDHPDQRQWRGILNLPVKLMVFYLSFGTMMTLILLLPQCLCQGMLAKINTLTLFLQEMAMRKVTRTQFEDEDDDMVRERPTTP